MINDLLERLRARRPTGDDGTTLIELMVGMAIMAVFMSIFTAAIVMMTQTANKVEAVSITSAQTSQAFLRLDKTVRYAAAITTPAVSTGTGDWYVELDNTTNGEVCTQLRVDKTTMQLQQRTWTVNVGSASSWTPLADYITNGGAASGSATVPFSFPAPATGVSTTFQRLQLVLVSMNGNAATSTNQSQMTFTALNSTGTPSSSTCQQWGRP